MTFTYTAPGVDPVSTVRYRIGDTIESEPLLSDEEIQFEVDQYLTRESGEGYYQASAAAAEAIANKLAREIDVSADGQSLGLSALRDRYIDVAVKMREQYEDALVGGASLYAGGMDANESPDPSVAPLAFGTGMHDNPEAGQQDYGDGGGAGYAQRRAQWGEEVP